MSTDDAYDKDTWAPDEVRAMRMVLAMMRCDQDAYNACSLWGNCAPRVGDRVRIQRDETRYRSKGTWPQFRGRTGIVVEINRDRVRPHLTEYGLAFGRVTRRTDGRGGLNWDAASLAWFKSYECRVIAERPAEPRWTVPPMDDPRSPEPGPRSAAATATASEWFARHGGAEPVLEAADG